MSINPIERSLEQTFEVEKWGRLICECEDKDILKEVALSLLQQLAQFKASSAWMASRASESENAKLEMLAELINQKNVNQHHK